MKQTAESTAVMNRKMVQQELPFEDYEAPVEPGWRGKRYLLCSDGLWHLVLEVHPNLMADTQCCADANVVLPVPSGDASPMCETCVKLHFAPKK